MGEEAPSPVNCTGEGPRRKPLLTMKQFELELKKGHKLHKAATESAKSIKKLNLPKDGSIIFFIMQ